MWLYARGFMRILSALGLTAAIMFGLHVANESPINDFMTFLAIFPLPFLIAWSGWEDWKTARRRR